MLLIIPLSLDITVTAAGVLALAGLIIIVYLTILRPALLTHQDRESPPPEEGTVEEIVVDTALRTIRMSMGQIDSDYKTRMNGIKEDHVTLKFQKDRDLEDYTIQITPGGPVLLRIPHSKKMERMQGAELVESRELIGDSLSFRLVASSRDARVTQYLEFELGAKYFINRIGEERMKFLLTLKKIFPSLDKNSRNKKGIYMFGRLRVGEASDAS